MTDDLVKRLRDGCVTGNYEGLEFIEWSKSNATMNEAADRIEALEAEVKRLEQQLKMARRLAHRSQPEYPPEIGVPHLRED